MRKRYCQLLDENGKFVKKYSGCKIKQIAHKICKQLLDNSNETEITFTMQEATPNMESKIYKYKGTKQKNDIKNDFYYKVILIEKNNLNNDKIEDNEFTQICVEFCSQFW